MKTVFVVGAGPAGMFAAKKIAQAGHEVIIFNRDIKPGGLAEYGIYPAKDKMKIGLRKQFAQVLALPNVHYFGHVSIGEKYALHLDDLRAFNPTATVYSVGAQGTKKLGLPGENARGVYSAKDFVYFYNQLPPFASQDFSTGKRVAIVGMGNVMVDIARWLLLDDPNHAAEEVIVVARRGPFEAKFDEKEMKHIEMFLDRRALQDEMKRVADRVAAVGQDIAKAHEIFPVLNQPPEPASAGPRMTFRFLCSPKEIKPAPDGRIQHLAVTENLLVTKGEGTAAKATDQTAHLDVDTMIFAIGDVHDPSVGLPMGPEGYSTRPDPANPASIYQLCDPQSGAPVLGSYVVGWARKASEGLVGIARHDAEVGAGYVLTYLETAPALPTPSAAEIQRALLAKGIAVVAKPELDLLARAEEKEATRRGIPFFKFSDDRAMLNAIEQERNSAVSLGISSGRD